MDEIKNNEILSKLISQTSRVFFSFDVEAGTINYLNNAFGLIWKRTRESVLHHPEFILESIHPDDIDFLQKQYRELLKGILKNDLEFRIILPDKSVKWLLLNPQLLFSAAGKKYVAGFLYDISEMKNNTDTLEKFAAKKNSVLEILSHDLAGPLANIKALSGMLSESTGKYENAELNNIIRIIRESSERSIRLIRDFVQQEFLESSNAALVKRRVNLVKKIQDTIDQYQEGEEHIKKDISFTSSRNTFYAYIDEVKFMQVINNLLSNAIKFTHDNGKIAIDLSERDEAVLITVKDNGVGIPEQYHNEVFDKFTKARREGLRGETSTGLGMSIIKTIVEWHNGRIWFESEENVGTTFYIELPNY
ncbi:PAS domain-containing sensor histidine kinase [Pontibacter anaerobius]|uniref:histidine kinase n=1 Tax=Pontibacter anaerobius TaxID=2993940 RepID=A0ABT3RJ91_9BACT|nr:PAS domain-containing sensor histidine kinase [Pontibacter anaerobius]MCX2741884.1 ATP-binding protein [Pontibacter anaerobius]